MRDIGKNIKQLRQQKNMTQDALAERLFVTRQTVSNYETGKSRPDIDMLVKIGEVLDTDIQQMIYGPEPKRLTPEVVRLITGCTLTAVFAILWVVLWSIGQDHQRRTFSILITIPLYWLVRPLCCLFGGWTAAQLLGMALRKRPLSGVWARRVGTTLLVLVVIWFALSAWYMAAVMLNQWQFDNFVRGEWIDAVNLETGEVTRSWQMLPAPVPAWLDWIVGLAIVRRRIRIPYHVTMLLPGTLLWLLGVPGDRKHK